MLQNTCIIMKLERLYNPHPIKSPAMGFEPDGKRGRPTITCLGKILTSLTSQLFRLLLRSLSPPTYTVFLLLPLISMFSACYIPFTLLEFGAWCDLIPCPCACCSYLFLRWCSVSSANLHWNQSCIYWFLNLWNPIMKAAGFEPGSLTQQSWLLPLCYLDFICCWQ